MASWYRYMFDDTDRKLIRQALRDWSFEHGDDRKSTRAAELADKFGDSTASWVG